MSGDGLTAGSDELVALTGEPVEFRLPWGTLRGEAWGQHDAPLLLAIHGWLDNAASWRRIGPALRDFRVVAIDLAGHGASDHRPAGVRYHHVDNLDDVMAVVDVLQPQRYCVVGHSMGAGIAPLVAAVDSRVSHMVLVEGIGSLTTSVEKTVATLREAVADMRKALRARLPVYPDRAAAIEARTQAIGKISVAAAELLCDRGLKTCDGGYTWTSDPRLRASSALRFTEEAVLAVLGEVRVPTLILLGTESPFKVEEHYKARLASLADVRKQVLPGNHHLHLEAATAGAMVKVLDQFLRMADTVLPAAGEDL